MGRLDFISYLHLSKSNLISVNESTAPQIFDKEEVLQNLNIVTMWSDKSCISLTDLI